MTAAERAKRCVKVKIKRHGSGYIIEPTKRDGMKLGEYPWFADRAAAEKYLEALNGDYDWFMEYCYAKRRA